MATYPVSPSSLRAPSGLRPSDRISESTLDRWAFRFFAVSLVLGCAAVGWAFFSI